MQKFLKKLFFFSCLLASCLLASANARVEGVFFLDPNKKITVTVKELLADLPGREPLTGEAEVGAGRTFSINLPVKKAGLFQLFVITGEGNQKSLYQSVIYLAPQTALKLAFEPKDSFRIRCRMAAVKEANNRSLILLQERFHANLEDGFNHPPATEAEVVNYLNRFQAVADSLLGQRTLHPLVKKYVRFKTADTRLSSFFQLISQPKGEIAFSDSFSVLPAKTMAFYKDSFMLLLPSAIQNLVSYLNLQSGLKPFAGSKSLEQISGQLQWLQAQGLAKKIQDRTAQRVLDGYITRYKATENYESDKARFFLLAGAIVDSTMSAAVKERFANLQYTLKGAGLPPAKLVDAEGKPVHLEQFKGRYVFIDLWASWCVPCIKMMPYMKQLEKDYGGKNVVFVTISIDEDKAAWLKKMHDLNLEGHQFWDAGHDLDKNLNVSGIPHYLLYDPNGRLLMYKTAMPDSPQLRQMLEGLLAPAKP